MFEEIGSTGSEFVLRFPRPKRFREATPERIEPAVRHLERSTYVGGLLPIKKEVGLGPICITITGSLQEPERHQRIEKVTC